MGKEWKDDVPSDRSMTHTSQPVDVKLKFILLAAEMTMKMAGDLHVFDFLSQTPNLARPHSLQRSHPSRSFSFSFFSGVLVEATRGSVFLSSSPIKLRLLSETEIMNSFADTLYSC